MSIVVTPIITATHAEWMATTNPIVQDRVVYETDTGNYKVGDGQSLYSALAYDTNISTFTNYVFMVPLDGLKDIFTGTDTGGSGGGIPTLWSPGVPAMSTAVGFNIAATAVNEGGTIPSGANTGVTPVAVGETPGKLLTMRFERTPSHQYSAIGFPMTPEVSGTVTSYYALCNTNVMSMLYSPADEILVGPVIGFGITDGTNLVMIAHAFFCGGNESTDSFIVLQDAFGDTPEFITTGFGVYNGSLGPSDALSTVSLNRAVQANMTQGGASWSNMIPSTGTIYSFLSDSNPSADNTQTFGLNVTMNGSYQDSTQAVLQGSGNGTSWLDTTGPLYFCVVFGDFLTDSFSADTVSDVNIFQLQTAGVLERTPTAPGY